METVSIISIFLSFFFHCMGLFYSPLEASTDSFVFVIMATMFLNKLKKNNGLKDPKNILEMIAECAILCLIMQVLLIAIWYPIHQVIQVLVNYMCDQYSDKLRFKVIDVIKGYTATGVVLAMEAVVFLKTFGIDDVQKFFGSKDDLISESILSIVAHQQKLVERRERRLLRQ